MYMTANCTIPYCIHKLICGCMYVIPTPLDYLQINSLESLVAGIDANRTVIASSQQLCTE